MKFRVSQWLDTSKLDAEEFPEKYGVQVKVNGRWIHVSNDDGILIFDSSNEAAAKKAELEQKFANTPEKA